MLIWTEEGRMVFGPSLNVRMTETGRIQIRRPLTETGRRELGYFYDELIADADMAVSVDFTPTTEIEVSTCTANWDLRKMMPRKFQKAPVMMDYLKAINTVVNAISCRVDTMGPLVDVNECPRRYLGHLASLIGYKLKNDQEQTVRQLREQIKMAIDIYKIKGTYNVLNFAFFMLGLKVQIWDLWTRDYLIFTRFPPHMHSGIPGGFNSGDTGLKSDDGWYFDENLRMDGGAGFKSSHFDIVITMNSLFYYKGLYQKLFVGELWPSIREIIEEFTPINTVPHFFLGLYCMCKEDYLVYTIPESQVKTCITNHWSHATYYFDMVTPEDIYLDQPGVDVSLGLGDTVTLTFDSAFIPVTDPQVMQRAGAITAFASHGVGQTTVVSANHGLSTGDRVTIAGSTSYDGSYAITKIDQNSYWITHAFGATHTGRWYKEDPSRVRANKVQLFLDDVLVAYDNGAGAWVSPGGVVTGGFINYASGRMRAVFAAAPGTGVNVKFHSTVDNIWMDWSFTSMLQAMTVFQLGTGNKGIAPTPAASALQTPVYTGTVKTLAITNEKLTFTLEVPIGTAINGCSELGIFHSGTGQLMVMSTFPEFDKPSDTVLEVTVDVFRKV